MKEVKVPSYDFKCLDCEHEFNRIVKIADREYVHCPCGSKVKQILRTQEPIMFRAGWYEHIDLNPVYIGSKRQLRGECDKRGLTSTYASEM